MYTLHFTEAGRDKAARETPGPVPLPQTQTCMPLSLERQTSPKKLHHMVPGRSVTSMGLIQKEN